MKIAYAFRRSIYYPYRGDPRGLPERDVRARLFAKIKEIGFEAVELGVDMVGGADAEEGACYRAAQGARGLRHSLRDRQGWGRRLAAQRGCPQQTHAGQDG